SRADPGTAQQPASRGRPARLHACSKYGGLMNKPTRRRFLKSAAALTGGVCAAGMCGVGRAAANPRKTDVRIERVSCRYEEHVFRVPLKFALTVVDRATMLTVTCTVCTAAGKVATGFGTLPLNYVFTFPSKKLSPDAR